MQKFFLQSERERLLEVQVASKLSCILFVCVFVFSPLFPAVQISSKCAKQKEAEHNQQTKASESVCVYVISIFGIRHPTKVVCVCLFHLSGGHFHKDKYEIQ